MNYEMDDDDGDDDNTTWFDIVLGLWRIHGVMGCKSMLGGKIL